LKDEHVRDIYEIGMEHIKEKYNGGQKWLRHINLKDWTVLIA
jgi:hypothetical protein